MGHTNYINNKPAFTDKQWEAFSAEVKTLLDNSVVPLAGWDGEGKPTFSNESIEFNGVGEDSHETASVSKESASFEFCKTAQKPYDEVVVAFYKLIRKYLPATVLSSDGDEENNPVFPLVD